MQKKIITLVVVVLVIVLGFFVYEKYQKGGYSDTESMSTDGTSLNDLDNDMKNDVPNPDQDFYKLDTQINAL